MTTPQAIMAAAKLKSERDRLGMTKRGAAYVLGVSKRTYQTLESDEPCNAAGITQEGAIARLSKASNASEAVSMMDEKQANE